MQFADRVRRVASLSARISRLQRLMAERPDDERLMIALAGLAKRAEVARNAFSEMVEETSFEVLDYRVSQIDDHYPIRSVADSLSDFQSSLTSVHDAIVNGPKVKARYSDACIAQTTLNLEFFYPGSKGFILSVPSEQDLFGGSLDKTADAISDYLDINNIDGARDASRTLGLAAISTLYKWVASNAKWGNSIDYEWKARKFKSTGQHIPFEKFALLEEVFRGAEEITREPLSFHGVLVGLDVSKRTFHLVQPGGESFKGRLHSDFPSEEWSIPHDYVASLIHVRRLIPATGEEKETYELVNLSV